MRRTFLGYDAPIGSGSITDDPDLLSGRDLRAVGLKPALEILRASLPDAKAIARYHAALNEFLLTRGFRLAFVVKGWGRKRETTIRIAKI